MAIDRPAENKDEAGSPEKTLLFYCSECNKWLWRLRFDDQDELNGNATFLNGLGSLQNQVRDLEDDFQGLDVDLSPALLRHHIKNVLTARR